MNKRYLSELIEILTQTNDKNTMYDFLEGILTPQELIEIPQRLAIVKMLKSGKPQHEIARKLGVGVATVTRGSKEIQKGRFQNVSWQSLSRTRG